MGLASNIVKTAACAVDYVRRPDAGLVVLIYHRVGGRTPVRVDLDTDVFDRQMSALAASGAVIDLDSAVARMREGEDLSGRVAVTFDDGTDDFVTDALPVLEQYGVPATLYVATAHIEEQLHFPDDGRPATWDGLAACVDSGLVTIGSHTHRHALLDRLRPEAIEAELDESIDLIRDRLGIEAKHFAYPKALAPSPAADAVVRDRFASAAIAGTRANPPTQDLYLLQRTPVQTTDTDRWFNRKVAGGMAFEDDLRQLINRRRYAGAQA